MVMTFLIKEVFFMIVRRKKHKNQFGYSLKNKNVEGRLASTIEIPTRLVPVVHVWANLVER
jgi:hypothetical protein